MKVIDTDIPDLKVIEPAVFGDSRGYFYESYNKSRFVENGFTNDFVQDNESMSNYGVIRGLHYQINPHCQTKLVRVIKGEVLDVVVDMRVGSPTFGKKFEILLSEENKTMLYVPRGFAHGFSVLRDHTIFSYKCDNIYHKESEGGINLYDEYLQIDWRIPKDKAVISEKDILLPSFENCKHNFMY